MNEEEVSMNDWRNCVVCLTEPSNFFEEMTAFTAPILFKSVIYPLAGPPFLACFHDQNHRKGLILACG